MAMLKNNCAIVIRDETTYGAAPKQGPRHAVLYEEWRAVAASHLVTSLHYAWYRGNDARTPVSPPALFEVGDEVVASASEYWPRLYNLIFYPATSVGHGTEDNWGDEQIYLEAMKYPPPALAMRRIQDLLLRSPLVCSAGKKALSLLQRDAHRLQLVSADTMRMLTRADTTIDVAAISPNICGPTNQQ